jgi:hypothetical protein
MNSQDILPMETRAIQSDMMNARIAGAYGTIGSWWAELENVHRWQAGSPDDLPDGMITVAQGGLLRILFDDLAGWRPFVSLRGVTPGRLLQCEMRYGYTDRPLVQAVPMTHDPSIGRQYGVGAVCDGTLGQFNEKCAIELSGGMTRGSWVFEQVIFGYTQLEGDS